MIIGQGVGSPRLLHAIMIRCGVCEQEIFQKASAYAATRGWLLWQTKGGTLRRGTAVDVIFGASECRAFPRERVLPSGLRDVSSCASHPDAWGMGTRRTMQFASSAEGHEEMRTYIRTLKGQH